MLGGGQTGQPRHLLHPRTVTLRAFLRDRLAVTAGRSSTGVRCLRHPPGRSASPSGSAEGLNLRQPGARR